MTSSLLVQSKVLLCGHDAEGVSVTHSSSPALHANDRCTLLENTELDGVHDAPRQTAVNILLPWCGLEIGLFLGEVEGVYTAVKVRVLELLATYSGEFEKNLLLKPWRYE
jgi:hypothetical protein